MENLKRYGIIVGRILIAWLFLHEAWFKITHWGATLDYMAHYGVPRFTLPGAFAVELFGGLALVTGFGARYAALILALFCISAAAIFHANWSDADQLLHFEKDIALAGALIVIALTRPCDKSETLLD